MNSTSLIEWLSENKNLNTISVIQQGISLLIGLAIFIKSYDFESMLSSVRAKRERSRKDKERIKLEKFKKLLEMAKTNQNIDISVMLDEKSDNESSDEKRPDAVMRTTRKKTRKIDMV